MRPAHTYDVIIIGAGIGGLVCGTRLAKEGLSVLIVEKNARPGGCVTSSVKKGFNFDYGAHTFGSCNDTGILRHYLRELGVNDIRFIRLDPAARFIFPDHVIEVDQDIDRYADRLKALYPKEADNIDRFFSEMVKVARSFSSKTLMARYRSLTFKRMLARHFKDTRLMAILAAQFRYLATPLRTLAATSMCLMMTSYLRDGTYYAEGGTQRLPDAIAGRFVSYGGTIVYGQEVVRILSGRGTCKGVMTGAGERYDASLVVSNADARKTLYDLIGKDAISRKLRTTIDTMKIGSSFFMTFLGIRDIPGLRDKWGWYHSSYDMESKKNESLYVFIPSLIDPSLAPSGMQSVELAMPFPGDPRAVRDWDGCKSDLERTLLDKAQQAIPGLKESIVYKESATPRTIEKFTNNSGGSICGWEMSPAHMHDGRLPYSTPVEGVYLAGHWTNPGAGVAPAATSGWIVSNMILNGAGSPRRNTCHEHAAGN